MLEVEKILNGKNIEYRLIELSGIAVTHEDVKKYAKDADPDDDCKTIIVKSRDGKKYGFFLRGMMKLNFSKVKDVIGDKVSIVSREELKEETGKDPGSICPFLLDMEIFIDKRVFERNKIHFGSGDEKYGLEINSKDIEKIINFQIVDIAKD